MPFLGNIVNFLGVLIFASVGALCRRGIPERINRSVFSAVAVAVVYIGISGALEAPPAVSEGAMLSASLGKFIIMILSLALGTLIGELIDIDKGVNKLGKYIELRLTKKPTADIEGESLEPSHSSHFAEGFASSTIMICVGAMAVNGALLDATGRPDVLIAKAVIDSIACFMLASRLGFGVALSAFPMLIYQGAITLFALGFTAVIPEAWITYLSVTGSLIILLIGTNFLGMTKVKTANMVPSLLLAPLFAFLFEIIGLI